MKNLSGNANWFAAAEEANVIEQKDQEVDDVRTVLSYEMSGIFHFLNTGGLPLVFPDAEKAMDYAKKNDLQNYVIDNFSDFDFTDIDILEM